MVLMNLRQACMRSRREHLAQQHLHRYLLAPENLAMLMNSRSRMVSAMDRMVRAPHAQPKTMMINKTVRNRGVAADDGTEDDQDRQQRNGDERIDHQHDRALEVAADIAPGAEADDGRNDGDADSPITPSISEFRMANTRNQKMSWPSALVPSRWSQETGMFLR